MKQQDRKKILLIADDISSFSGVGSMAREIVIGTSHEFNWVTVGAAINHPHAGQRLDLSGNVNKHAGIDDSSVIIYPYNGYGDPGLIRKLIKDEKPDALMIFTDPRYFVWLFQIEDEIRKKLPIMYYTIWDSVPYPYYNRAYYESCDSLFAISKQTENIVRTVLEEQAENKLIKYIPHGINEKLFFPIIKPDQKYEDFKKHMLGHNEYEFVVFWNSRNIHRKHPGDVILSFQHFVSSLPKEEAKKCVLIMHTQPVDENGTNLYAVRDTVCDPEYCNVIFSTERHPPENMNYLYNMADVTMLISSNEGWGLSLTESMMTGTMIIANVTGGMQDQLRFEDENGKWIEFNESFPSNHFGTYSKCGEWAIPVFPSNMSLAGSVPTPYIYDDRANFLNVTDALHEVYNMTKEERIRKGMLGYEWAKSDEALFTAENMSKNMIEGIYETLDRFEPTPVYTLTKVEDIKPKRNKYLVY